MTDPSRYRVLRSLGRGGMGEVFLADDQQLGRKVAIKFLSEGIDGEQIDQQRLFREARSAAALDHPYICKIYELANIDGRTGIVMEHVAGETAQARLRRGPLAPKQALVIGSEIAEALEEAHKRRVVHRDLKPSNVMLTEQGHVKVMDFGLAKQTPSSAPLDEAETIDPLTAPGVRIGTPAYMAPEQLLAGEADERSDIFAFGILLYELLTGVHPFTRSSQAGTMSAILRETPAPVHQYAKGAPNASQVVLGRLLAKEPQHRYQSFGEVRTDLGQLLHDASGWTPVPQAAPVAETASARRTPYVGRESQQAEVRQFLDRTVAGHGGVVLIGGEPGVGKTRLAEEILAEARLRGCVALTGRCYEMEGTPPFIPWVEMVEHSARIVPTAAFREAIGDAAPEVARLVPELRQMFPDIPPPIELPPEQQRRYLFNNFLSFLERGARVTPYVLLIDDMHWADDSTLLLFQHIAQHVARTPMLIIGTYRDVDLDVARPFAKTLEALTRQRLAHKVTIRRLPETGVRDMLEALGGRAVPSAVVRAVYRETEGNPFFVEEVFQYLSEEERLFDAEGHWRTDLQVEALDVPESIRLVIGRRIERLSEDTRRILTTAAVVGRSFDLVLLKALGDAGGDALLTALEEAEAAKLILSVSAGRDVGWTFAHGLIRQTLESSLSLPRRQRAHLRVAEAMERAYGARVDRYASDMAQHLYQAGAAAAPEKAVRFLILAGDQALEAGAFDEALRQFDRALSIQDEDNLRAMADLRYKRGHALRSLGRGEAALEEWRLALSDYENLGDVDGIGRTLYDAVWATNWCPPGSAALGGLSPMRAAQALAQHGLNLVGPDHEVARCRLLALAAVWAARAGDDYRASIELLQEAETLGKRSEDPKVTVELLDARVHVHYAYLQCPQTVDVGWRAIALREERGEPYDACDDYWAIMLSSNSMGRFHAALDVAQTLEALATRVGHLSSHWNVQWSRTWVHFVTTGDLARSEALVRRDLEDAERTNPVWRGLNHTALGLVRFYAGDWPAARSEFDAAVRLNFESFADRFYPSVGLLARAYDGEHDALDSLQAVASSLLGMPEENPLGVWEQLLNVVEGLAVLGHGNETADLYPIVLKGIKNGVVLSYALRLWQMVAGIAAGAGGNRDAAREHFETALRQAHELPHKIAQPEVRRWYAHMLLDDNTPGSREKARTLLGEAVEMYQTIGMPRHVEMAQQLLKGA